MKKSSEDDVFEPYQENDYDGWILGGIGMSTRAHMHAVGDSWDGRRESRHADK